MRSKQAGVFLISATIAVAVVGMLITFWGVNYSRQMRTEKAERVGEALKAIGNAVDTFAVRYHADIHRVFDNPSETFSVNGIEFKHTLADNTYDEDHLGNLSAQNLIKALQLPGVSSRPPSGVGEYAIRVYRACSGTPKICQVRTLAFLTEPMKRTYSSETDFDFAATAARRIGAAGGVSQQDKPQNFRFIDEKDSPVVVKNPRNVAGLIAIRGGAQTDNLNLNVKRDGSLPMTGNLNMSGKDARGNDAQHSIEGVKDITGFGQLKMDALEIRKGAKISGKLNLENELNLTKNDIVGARDIRGSGELVMNSLSVKDAKIDGTITAKKGARLEGELNMSGNKIKGAKTVEAGTVTASGNLKSGKGLVELDDNVRVGDMCNIWGLGRDNDGRVVSCQREKQNSDVRRWKLSSSPQTVKEVPVAIREEIERLVRTGEGWTMHLFDIVPSPASSYPANTYYARNPYYLTKVWSGKLMACGVVPWSLRFESNDKTPIASLGRRYVVGTSSERLACLFKGRANVILEAYDWTWGTMGGTPGDDDRWGKSLGHTRNPIAVYDDKHAEFKPILESLMLNLSAQQARPDDWSRQDVVVGKRWFYKLPVVVDRALSCEVTDRGGATYSFLSTGEDPRTGSPRVSGSERSVELACSFADGRDMAAEQFKRCDTHCLRVRN
ncbi:hypothetical protein [Pandoraea pnomenusa]|uniref:hypothetical protein n=1 Tax=Pandoraea pnomenusa TaxID=93220 RepID=UPI00333E483E